MKKIFKKHSWREEHKLQFTIAWVLFASMIISTIFHFLDKSISHLFFEISFALLSIIFPFYLISIVVSRWKWKNFSYLEKRIMKRAKKEIPDRIYKFTSLTEDNKLNVCKLNTIRNNQVWLSSFTSLNDPFEGQLFQMPTEIEQVILSNFSKDYSEIKIDKLKQIMMHQRDSYAQSSFSKDWHNIPMWGYYANGGKGYCMEYKVLNKEFLFPIIYTDRRPVISGIYADFSTVKRIKVIEENVKRCDTNDFLNYFLYPNSFKSKEWEQEKEVRLLECVLWKKGQLGMNEYLDSYGLEASKILIGFQCEYKEELIEIAKHLKIPYSVVVPNFRWDTYELIEETKI